MVVQTVTNARKASKNMTARLKPRFAIFGCLVTTVLPLNGIVALV
ncbi:MAG: hypothetical protein AAB241_03185 [Pseudomonadota bacterium]